MENVLCFPAWPRVRVCRRLRRSHSSRPYRHHLPAPKPARRTTSGVPRRARRRERGCSHLCAHRLWSRLVAREGRRQPLGSRTPRSLSRRLWSQASLGRPNQLQRGRSHTGTRAAHAAPGGCELGRGRSAVSDWFPAGRRESRPVRKLDFVHFLSHRSPTSRPVAGGNQRFCRWRWPRRLLLVHAPHQDCAPIEGSLGPVGRAVDGRRGRIPPRDRVLLRVEVARVLLSQVVWPIDCKRAVSPKRDLVRRRDETSRDGCLEPPQNKE